MDLITDLTAGLRNLGGFFVLSVFSGVVLLGYLILRARNRVSGSEGGAADRDSSWSSDSGSDGGDGFSGGGGEFGGAGASGSYDSSDSDSSSDSGDSGGSDD